MKSVYAGTSLEGMKLAMIFMVGVLIFLGCSVNAQIIDSPSPSPAPAPAQVNLTELFTVAGPFSTFLNYLVSNKIIDTFQKQANNTQQGITIFVPKNEAFSSLKKPSISNLTNDQLKSLLLYHALPKYYALADFNNLSKSNPVSTFAGGQYTLNITYTSGVIHVNSGWSNPKISSSVYTTDPVSVYQIDRVLLPQIIFGVPPQPAPTPAPTPDASITADARDGSPSSVMSSLKSPPSPSSSYNFRFGMMNYLAVTVSGCLTLFL